MYEFTEDCMLHIDAIDEEHKRLFQMINEAFELVEKTEDVTHRSKPDRKPERLRSYAPCS